MKIGDRVRVVKLTDPDGEIPTMHTREEAAKAGLTYGPLPGDTATVTAIYCDYLPIGLRLDGGKPDAEDYAMTEEDLELL